jgi:hypothetical protein
MIREVLLGAAAMYVIILLAQIIERPSVALEAIAAASIIAIAAGLYLYDHPHRVHNWESVALWTAVLLFLAYGIFRYLTGGP